VTPFAAEVIGAAAVILFSHVLFALGISETFGVKGSLGPNGATGTTGIGSLRRVDCGTELEIVQEGVPSVIPIENC
jgi:hypothetical protein